MANKKRRRKKKSLALKNDTYIFIAILLTFAIVFCLILFFKNQKKDKVYESTTENTVESTTEKNTEKITKPTNSLEPTFKHTGSIYDGIRYISPVAKTTDINKYGRNLMLLNNYNKLPEHFEWDLVYWSNGKSVSYSTLDKKENYSVKAVDRAAYEPLKAMFCDAEKAGCPLQMVSAFRSLSLQDNLFGRAVTKYMNQGLSREEAIKKENIERTFPGTSEHHTGLCFDIVEKGNFVLSQSFDKTKEFAWLSKHAEEYGFILRYRKDKEKETEIMYEPWHYRYVGVENAKKINSMNMCLEEYIEYLDSNN